MLTILIWVTIISFVLLSGYFDKKNMLGISTVCMLIVLFFLIFLSVYPVKHKDFYAKNLCITKGENSVLVESDKGEEVKKSKEWNTVKLSNVVWREHYSFVGLNTHSEYVIIR